MVSEEQNSEMELASEDIPVPQVQPEIRAPEVVNEDKEEDIAKKSKEVSPRKSRHRKNILYAAIRNQMEFYFGDSNLCRDRFLTAMIKENPYVDIDTILTFNKIRALTTNKKVIVKALRESEILKVSDDGNKIIRVTPLVEKTNIDECSIYIQGLPLDADHDWLRKLFSEYGPVVYVSIPKFKHNQKIKGFAFLEFDTPESAQKCLKVFKKKGLTLPMQTQSSDLLSITTYEEEEQHKKDLKVNGKKKRKIDDWKELDETDCSKAKKKRTMGDSDKDSNTCPSDSNTDKEEKQDRKRKNKVPKVTITDSDTESQNCIKKVSKKQKKNKVTESETTENELDDTKTKESSNKNKSKKKKKKLAEKEETEDKDNEIIEDNLTEKTSSKKKKKLNLIEDNEINIENNGDINEYSNDEAAEKKKKKRKKVKHGHQHEPNATDEGLQILSKRDWKILRNKYLNIQRAKMKQLKQHLKGAQWNQWGEHKMKAENNYEEIVENKIKNVDEIQNPASRLEFIPGVIVKVELSKVCVDPKGFKNELKGNHIKYIDIKEGSNIAYIRCESSEAAKELTGKSTNDRCFKLLDEEEEKNYWDKIVKDRDEKFGNKIRIKQRGRDKLLKKAEKVLGKHIKFDEE